MWRTILTKKIESQPDTLARYWETEREKEGEREIERGKKREERTTIIWIWKLEWDRFAAMVDLVLMRPSVAPRAILVLRGTLLKSPTMWRDFGDDLRFLAWESLKGSVRFKVALEALKSVANRYGSNNVCIVRHSLGVGFAFQVGKTLAKEGRYVETENPFIQCSFYFISNELKENGRRGWVCLEEI